MKLVLKHAEKVIETFPLILKKIPDATVRLLSDPLLTSRLGNNGRRRVMEHFTWEEKAKRVGQLLSSSGSKG